MNSKLVSRLLIFFVGLPLVLSTVWFLPQKNHLAVNILITVFCALGAVEFSSILKHKNILIGKIEAAVLGLIIPTSVTILVSFMNSAHPIIIQCFFALGAAWVLISRTFLDEKKLDGVINYLAAGFAVLFYPGAFLSWVILMNRLPQSNYLIVAFLFIVLINDSLAWFFGILFGKNNRGLIAASMNKSLAGFIGGMLASVAAGVCLAVFLPDIFKSARYPAVVSGLILGFLTGLAGILGDLSESAIKRSAGVKDSGGMVPGRGGILDSIDSLCLAAPVFYMVFRFLFL
ncbi:MAG: phosphatidate cytidylyltransferase [Termitinemataceae bacterium]|nr:MAG: phosphatidate cytidylyltransferase [Termitinemataceae bacterium]